MIYMSDLVEETSRSRKFKDVQNLTCQDRKRYMECEVTHETGNNAEGRFKAQDVVIENADVEKFSTAADKINAEFSEDTTCSLYKENNVLSCRTKDPSNR